MPKIIFFGNGPLADYSKAILAETPNMLPQLKQAKVVDAGGAGFVSILEGIVSYLNGNPVFVLNSSPSHAKMLHQILEKSINGCSFHIKLLIIRI